ncbi:ABC transporter substrate-binding protein [Pseudocolwellia sp. AS88]|uniref:MlaC/ttg2D family ABC transporter substrate-binding protein n=1 Tax=Pseudocolwellia sp. AS88 TaxID=3063958 RepID=UPI0026F0C7ED|nr:ABC transporter substrate-binding protein [Pseudocolwellia sp. AS88]MDO7083902.1 ABC transporter substrate-binding protein [Pseudocolwellia sp. AS88]
MKKSSKKNVDIFVILFIALSLLIANMAMASADDAESKVKQVFEQIESSLTNLKTTNQFTKSNIRDELNKSLLPEVNIKFFSSKVLSKNLQKVPEELREEFSTELSKQLINTYSNMLSKYDNEKITIGQGSLSKSGKIAMVNVTIVGESATNKAVVKLLKSNEDVWQFFDIVVEGISLLDSKQAEINSSFNKLGAEGTLQRIKELNIRSINAS